ncbi:MAG: methylmalonyl-CoA mutase family protein [Candidatus Solibacter sp.]|nr:methylmalonyl-CoA mutase family protein [Candidatus Solibacter sp.]
MKTAGRQFTTISGVPLEPLYGPGDFESPPPGEFPYTRGIHPDMYRGKLWTMRQFSGFATPEETNLRYHCLPAGAGTDRPFRGVRPAHPHGLRRRPRPE